MTVDATLIAAVDGVWRLKPPGPAQLTQHPAFLNLAALCTDRYGSGVKLAIALHQALSSIGLPFQFAKRPDLIVSAEQAATALDKSLCATSRVIRYLVPLDQAEDLPPMTFGSCRVAHFSAEELAGLFDSPRLARLYPNYPLDVKRLAAFHWLIVEEESPLDPRPEARAVPFFFEPLDQDFGAVDPHRRTYPEPVERALFFLLTAPWEEWVTHAEIEWRGFRVPWVYTLDADICVRPARPPDPGSLSWEPYFFEDHWGEEVEDERPSELSLEDHAGAAATALLTDANWRQTEAALAGPAFETPVRHFFVRAFLTDGIDEFMAHITTIEAALGMEADHRKGLRQQPDPDPDLRSTGRMVARIAALIDDLPAARIFGDLFDLRSEFIHGRKANGAIPSAQQVAARDLARRVVKALVDHSCSSGCPRENLLYDLLTAGAAMLRKVKSSQGSALPT
jgi:hypothetical protein